MSTFELASNLHDIIARYTVGLPNTDPANNRAAVLIFDFRDSLMSSVNLTRTSPGGAKEAWPHSLNGRRRWINHQALNWLYPPNSITWTLEVCLARTLFSLSNTAPPSLSGDDRISRSPFRPDDAPVRQSPPEPLPHRVRNCAFLNAHMCATLRARQHPRSIWLPCGLTVAALLNLYWGFVGIVQVGYWAWVPRLLVSPPLYGYGAQRGLPRQHSHSGTPLGVPTPVPRFVAASDQTGSGVYTVSDSGIIG